jgi:DNA polymerase III delta prime subunit
VSQVESIFYFLSKYSPDMAELGIAAETDYLQNEKIRVDVSIVSVVNYALQQNKLPLVQSISIINNSEHEIGDVELRITSTPEFIHQFVTSIPYIPANNTFDIKDITLHLDAEYLASLTEKITGSLHISLSSKGTVLYSEDIDVTALAFDEWHGYSIYPELLAAFVTPNHPEVTKINARAAEILGDWTGDPSLDAYQTPNPDRAKQQAAAVFVALQEQNIIYSVPPTSFEKIGQRVRLCDAVLQTKMGTCLDLSLLYGSCLESIGLNPILIIKPGHVFAGFWLDNHSFPESVMDDASFITKRLASGINKIGVVECTLCVSGKHSKFDEACKVAEGELVGEDSVDCIIDIKRARLSGISPLPIRVQTEYGWSIEHEIVNKGEYTAIPDEVGTRLIIDDNGKKEEFSKIALWERKLLDLSQRNSLISMRMVSTVVPILSASLDELEDALEKGTEFVLHSLPLDWSIPKTHINFETIHNLGDNAAVIRSEFNNKRLRSIFSEDELAERLTKLSRVAKTSLEENGANTLYLALGILRWYEKECAQQPRYAPIVLIPVEIVRKYAAQKFVLRIRDDEPQINITLLEKLKQDFLITVNGLDTIPLDDNGVDTRKIFTILRKSVMEQKRWEVLESAYLGIFSFSQFVMWNDIRNRTEDLKQNKIVKSLVDGKLSWDAHEMDMGSYVSEDNLLLPIPADASQLYAIKAGSNGQSFVLHGPPGTGKSQTITALIANILAEGKTVLFIAEKMAALEVVQKRLEAIGLGPFCLELHSNKSKKKDILDKLNKTTSITKHQPPEEYEKKANHIANLRKELNDYAVTLHKPLKCGKNLHTLINCYEEYNESPDICSFSQNFAKTITITQIDSLTTLVERLIAAAEACGYPHNHPLNIIQCRNYSQELRYALPDLIKNYQESINSIDAISKNICVPLGFSPSDQFTDLNNLASQSKSISDDLDRYTESLHKQLVCGLTLYDLLFKYEEFENVPDIGSFSPEFAEEITETEFESKNEFIERLVFAAKEIDSPYNHPLSFVTTKNYPSDAIQSLPALLDAYDSVIDRLSDASAKFAKAIRKDVPLKLEDIERLVSDAQTFALWTDYPSAWADATNGYFSGIREMTQQYLNLGEIYAEITKTWMDSFLTLNGDELNTELSTILSKWVLPRNSGLKKLAKQVSTYAKRPVQKEELGSHFRLLSNFQKLKVKADELFATYGRELEHFYTGENTNWKQIFDASKMAEKLSERVSLICNISSIRNEIGNIRSLDRIVDDLIHAWNSFGQQKKSIYELFEISDFSTVTWLSKQKEICKTLRDNENKLSKWIKWNSVSSQARELGLGLVVDAYYSGVDPENIKGGYNKALYKSLIIDALVSDSSISDIVDSDSDIWNKANQLRELCKLDRTYKQIYPDKSLHQGVNEMNLAWSDYEDSKNKLYSLLDISESITVQSIPKQIEMCNSISSHIDILKEWITWNSIAYQANENGLNPIVDCYYSGVSHENILNGFKKALFKSLIISAIDSDNTLMNFSGPVFNEKIQQFKRKDKEITELSKQEIYCRLAAKIPNFVKEAAQSSDIGILQRAIRSKGRGMSIRKLFELIPNLLSRLCPCMLMSPISAAQYLSLNRDPFDVVVFDEASQLPTCKAIGPLSRGIDAVIVGDPKQLPPTSFFAANTIDEENPEEVLDSVLDDCLALSMPQTHLLWHYRSRHESLIAFSNNMFYENQLYTFPSVDGPRSKVKLVHVDGIFERGTRRVNVEEAKAIVKDIKRRCHDKVLSKRSVGIVTFNAQQQALIDDILARECANDSKLEEWAFESEEPIFIKNLENVQGDERDVILFSIGYGPDINGKVSMNFGPLNRDGGERRLNVAISRARYEMTVYATLTPEQINLSKTSSRGVAELRGFLEYASGKPLSQDENTIEPKSILHTDGIAKTICDILKEHGYDTDLSVGHSKFRVDVGVINPENPDKYLLGILLDGDNYNSAKTTRDREIAQINVLNGLGWHVIRIWTMDWWDNRQKEISRILNELEQIKNGSSESAELDYEVKENITPPIFENPIIERLTALASTNNLSRLYSPTKLGMQSLSSFMDAPVEDIKSKLMKVIDHESPISAGLLIRRVVQSYGFSRTGSNIQRRMLGIMFSLPVEITNENGQNYYWNNNMTSGGYRDFRCSGEGDSKRDAKDVSVTEAVNALCYALSEQISLSQDDLIREGAKCLGYTRLGNVVSDLMSQAIISAETTGRIKLDKNKKWVLCDER